MLDQAAGVDPIVGQAFVQGAFDPHDAEVEVENFQGLDRVPLYYEDVAQEQQDAAIDEVLRDVDDPVNLTKDDPVSTAAIAQEPRVDEPGSSSKGKQMPVDPHATEGDSDVELVDYADSDSEDTVVEVETAKWVRTE